MSGGRRLMASIPAESADPRQNHVLGFVDDRWVGGQFNATAKALKCCVY